MLVLGRLYRLFRQKLRLSEFENPKFKPFRENMGINQGFLEKKGMINSMFLEKIGR